MKIKSAVVLVPQIQQGETTRVTVSVQTIIGGDVTIELQSPGNAIGPVRYTIKTKPGETVSRNFDQFFPAAGNFRLLVLAKDARSDDSARAYVVVTEKVKFDGHYTGTIAIQAKAGNRIEPMSFVLDFVVKDNKVAGRTGVAHAASEKSAPLKSSPNVSSKIAGEVDDKGNLTATWSYRDEAREPSGAIYASHPWRSADGIDQGWRRAGRVFLREQSVQERYRRARSEGRPLERRDRDTAFFRRVQRRLRSMDGAARQVMDARRRAGPDGGRSH